MEAPLVSIALCAYNGAKYLRQQMDTLVNQTYPNLEIVVVDDRSGDDTVEIIQEYIARYPNVRLEINAENLGYIRNFEKAISLCKGDYIALADQDDIWDLEKIALLVDNIRDDMLIYHDSEFVDESGKSLNKKVSDVRRFYSGDNANIFLFENCVSGHAMLFKSELLNYFKGFNPVIMHDWWLTYIACNNGGVTYIDQSLVQYRQHTNANTNILRQDRGQVKKKESLIKIEKQLAITRSFAEYEYNKDVAFKQKLLRLMEARMRGYFSFRLAWFIFVNRDVLLFIQKKSTVSKLNFISKFAWGYKLKQLLN